jgi:hypothetical protein
MATPGRWPRRGAVLPPMTDSADTSSIQPTEEHKPASAEPMSLLSVSAGSLNVGSGPRQAEHQMPILAAAAEEYLGIIYWIIIDSVVVYEDKRLAATFDLVTSSAKHLCR